MSISSGLPPPDPNSSSESVSFDAVGTDKVEGDKIEIEGRKPCKVEGKQKITARVEIGGSKYNVTMRFHLEALGDTDVENTLKKLLGELEKKDFEHLTGKKIKTSTTDWSTKEVRIAKGKYQNLDSYKGDTHIKATMKKTFGLFESHFGSEMAPPPPPSPSPRVEEQEEKESVYAPLPTEDELKKKGGLLHGTSAAAPPETAETAEGPSHMISFSEIPSKKGFLERVNNTWNNFTKFAASLDDKIMKNLFIIDVKYGIRSKRKTAETDHKLTDEQKKVVQTEIKDQIDQAFKKYTDHKKAVKSGEKTGEKIPYPERFNLASVRRELISDINKNIDKNIDGIVAQSKGKAEASETLSEKRWSNLEDLEIFSDRLKEEEADDSATVSSLEQLAEQAKKAQSVATAGLLPPPPPAAVTAGAPLPPPPAAAPSAIVGAEAEPAEKEEYVGLPGLKWADKASQAGGPAQRALASLANPALEAAKAGDHEDKHNWTDGQKVLKGVSEAVQGAAQRAWNGIRGLGANLRSREKKLLPEPGEGEQLPEPGEGEQTNYKPITVPEGPEDEGLLSTIGPDEGVGAPEVPTATRPDPKFNKELISETPPEKKEKIQTMTEKIVTIADKHRREGEKLTGEQKKELVDNLDLISRWVETYSEELQGIKETQYFVKDSGEEKPYGLPYSLTVAEGGNEIFVHLKGVYGEAGEQDTIGKGKFGHVRLAVELNSGEVAARKAGIRKEDDTAEVGDRTPIKSAEAKTEGDIAIDLSKSKKPGIVKTWAVCMYAKGKKGQPIQEKYGFMTEHVNGGSLEDALTKGDLSDENKRIIAMGVCEGITSMAELGYCHNDLHAGNVLLQRDGDGRVIAAKIADFGQTREKNKILQKATPKPNRTLIHPEFFSNQSNETLERKDDFNLGLLLYKLYTGKKSPWQKMALEALKAVSLKNDRTGFNELATHPEEHLGLEKLENFSSEDLPPEVKSIITGLLETYPNNRLSASEALETLKKLPEQSKERPASSQEGGVELPKLDEGLESQSPYGSASSATRQEQPPGTDLPVVDLAERAGEAGYPNLPAFRRVVEQGEPATFTLTPGGEKFTAGLRKVANAVTDAVYGFMPFRSGENASEPTDLPEVHYGEIPKKIEKSTPEGATAGRPEVKSPETRRAKGAKGAYDRIPSPAGRSPLAQRKWTLIKPSANGRKGDFLGSSRGESKSKAAPPPLPPRNVPPPPPPPPPATAAPSAASAAPAAAPPSPASPPAPSAASAPPPLSQANTLSDQIKQGKPLRHVQNKSEFFTNQVQDKLESLKTIPEGEQKQEDERTFFETADLLLKKDESKLSVQEKDWLNSAKSRAFLENKQNRTKNEIKLLGVLNRFFSLNKTPEEPEED